MTTVASVTGMSLRKTKVGAVSTLVPLCVVVDAKDVYDKSRCDSVTPKIRQPDVHGLHHIPTTQHAPETQHQAALDQHRGRVGGRRQQGDGLVAHAQHHGGWTLVGYMQPDLPILPSKCPKESANAPSLWRPARCWDNRCRPMTRQQEYVAGQSPQFQTTKKMHGM